MQHAGPPAGTERQAPCHSSVRQGSGAEEAAASGGGSEGELGDGLRGIQGSDGECNGVRYLGRVLTEVDDDCLAVVGNLGKARKSWGWLSWILNREGADPKLSGHFYKAVAQAVLLFGAEMWVLTPRMEQALDRFEHKVARRLTGRQPRRRGVGSWSYLPFEEAMGEVGFEGIRKAVTRRQNTVAQ